MDLFGKEILLGSQVVYPARPGGHGPLVLVAGRVVDSHEHLGEIDLDVEGSSRPIRIKRTDRVAVVTA